jgi:Rieske Fe-S protein
MHRDQHPLRMNFTLNQSRRRFVKTLTLGTAFSMLLGKPWRAVVLADCTASNTGRFKIRLDDYPALQQEGGSVRLSVNPVRPDEQPFPDGDFWPILINRGAGNTFYVLDAECRHESCVVPAYDVDMGGILCPCHGSLYAIDGSVLRDPAVFPLRTYQFAFDNNTLTIDVPNLGFCVNASVAPGGPAARLQLAFPTHLEVQYELYFRERSQDPWTLIRFATTPDGPADQMLLTANGAPATLFVDRATFTGFYAVAMRLLDVT